MFELKIDLPGHLKDYNIEDLIAAWTLLVYCKLKINDVLQSIVDAFKQYGLNVPLDAYDKDKLVSFMQSAPGFTVTDKTQKQEESSDETPDYYR